MAYKEKVWKYRNKWNEPLKKVQNVAGSCSWTVVVSASYRPRPIAPYGGYQGIFNATSSVISGQAAYGPKWNKAIHEKTIGGTK